MYYRGVVKLCAVWLAVCSAVTVPPWTIQQAQQQGPNVCVLEEIPGTKYKLWTECKYWTPRLICGQKPILKYECCGGYTRVPGEHGCTAVNQMENILETAKNLGAKKFVQYIEESGGTSVFTDRGPITLFAPSDEAFQEMSIDKLRKIQQWRGAGVNPVLLYHSVPGRVYSHRFKGDLTVESRQPNKKLRINKFSSKIDTVNCARILRKDEEATNGVVHIIDSVLDPETWQPFNIVEAITKDGRFSQFARFLEVTRLSDQLKKSDNAVTIFVPSDEAFNSLAPDHQYRLINDRTILTELVKSHIVSHPLCLPALTKDLKLRTLSDSTKINIGCETGRYMMENNRLGDQFINTPNGLIHAIDHIIFQDQFKSTDQLLDRNNTRIFRHVFRTSDLEKTLRDSRPYTMFAPSDQAMTNLSPTYLQALRTNKGEARKFCTNHILKKKFGTENIIDNERQRAMNEEQNLVFQVHRKRFGVNGALIEQGDIIGLDCIVHIITRVILPPKQTLQQMLQGNTSYSIFSEALEKMRRYDPQLFEMTQQKTILIPTNQAFYRLGQSSINNIQTNQQYLNKVVRSHIISGLHSSEAFQPGLHYLFKTKGSDLNFNKNGDLIQVNGGELLQCDIATKNGLGHIIDKVLVPSDDY